MLGLGHCSFVLCFSAVFGRILWLPAAIASAPLLLTLSPEDPTTTSSNSPTCPKWRWCQTPPLSCHTLHSLGGYFHVTYNTTYLLMGQSHKITTLIKHSNQSVSFSSMRNTMVCTKYKAEFIKCAFLAILTAVVLILQAFTYTSSLLALQGSSS